MSYPDFSRQLFGKLQIMKESDGEKETLNRRGCFDGFPVRRRDMLCGDARRPGK
jgi:hypothetical protein